MVHQRDAGVAQRLGKSHGDLRVLYRRAGASRRVVVGQNHGPGPGAPGGPVDGEALRGRLGLAALAEDGTFHGPPKLIKAQTDERLVFQPPEPGRQQGRGPGGAGDGAPGLVPGDDAPAYFAQEPEKPGGVPVHAGEIPELPEGRRGQLRHPVKVRPHRGGELFRRFAACVCEELLQKPPVGEGPRLFVRHLFASCLKVRLQRRSDGKNIISLLKFRRFQCIVSSCCAE